MLKKIPESITISMYAFNVTINNIIYLPPEIIEVIYTFVIKEYYAKIIFKHWFNSKLVYNCLKFILDQIVPIQIHLNYQIQRIQSFLVVRQIFSGLLVHFVEKLEF